jgi:hypothetical protein
MESWQYWSGKDIEPQNSDGKLKDIWKGKIIEGIDVFLQILDVWLY